MATSRLRSVLKPLACALFASIATLNPAPASAASPFLVIPESSVAEASPAYRYANMTNDEAMAELDRRKILYLTVASAPGVRAPVRLTGRLNGVYFRSVLPPEQRVTSMFEILDARLALALDDFAAVLARHDIDEVVHYTMYRPNVPRPGRDGVEDDGDHDHAASAAKTSTPAEPVAASKATATAEARPAAKETAKVDARSAAKVDAPPAPNAAPRRSAAADKEGGAAKDEKPRERTQAAGAKNKETPGAADAGEASSKPARTIIGRGAPPKPAPRSTARSRGGAQHKPAETLKPGAAPQAAAAPAKRRDKVARRGTLGQKPRAAWAPPGTRHPAGLAIDVGALKKRDGTWMSVARHFHGRVGDKTCGEGVVLPELPEARELRSIVCEAADLGLFTYVLTPNFNAAHADHYHMEIKPEVRWFLYH